MPQLLAFVPKQNDARNEYQVKEYSQPYSASVSQDIQWIEGVPKDRIAEVLRNFYNTAKEKYESYAEEG